MKNKSKSYSNFKIRELSHSEKILLNKYNDDSKQKSKKNINFGVRCSNLKLNLYYKKIEIRKGNKNYLRLKHSTNNDNYYNSILNDKKNTEYLHNLYNDENINLSNTNTIINTDYLNSTENIISQNKKNFQFNKSKTISCKNIFKINQTDYTPNLITNNISNINLSKNSLKLYNDIMNNKLYNIPIINTTINPYLIRKEKNKNFFMIPKEKSKPIKIKNKIIFQAVNLIRKKRTINNNDNENRKSNNFKFSSIYKKLKLEKNENRNLKPLFKYSSIMTELINKNKRKKIFL